MCRPAGHRGHCVERQADKAADEAEGGAQPVGRDREINGHRPPFQILQREIAAGMGGAEPGVVEPGGVALGGRQDRAALALGAAEMGGGSARGQRLPAALGGGEHVGEDLGELVFGGGRHRAQHGHGAMLGRQARDMDQKAAQQVAGGVVPVRLALEAGAYHSMSARVPARLTTSGWSGSRVSSQFRA
jgi:hypothetical protein